jgi:hypothetical protein
MEAPTYHSETFVSGIFLCCHVFETGSQGWEVPVMPRASKKLLCYSQRTETDWCICFPIRKVETWDVVLEESRRRTQDEIDGTIRHRGQCRVAGTCNNSSGRCVIARMDDGLTKSIGEWPKNASWHWYKWKSPSQGLELYSPRTHSKCSLRIRLWTRRLGTDRWFANERFGW